MNCSGNRSYRSCRSSVRGVEPPIDCCCHAFVCHPIMCSMRSVNSLQSYHKDESFGRALKQQYKHHHHHAMRVSYICFRCTSHASPIPCLSSPRLADASLLLRHVSTPLTDYRFLLDDLAPVARWGPYSLHDVLLDMFPGLGMSMYYPDPAQHLGTAGYVLHNLDDRSDPSEMCTFPL